ncbi:MAG: Na+/H+ antiporter NhaC family protein [Thermoprotei archaeon]|nr:MAG: Na+/H+ antiporter NhaC family protein [Thermoprotei archaeon]
MEFGKGLVKNAVVLVAVLIIGAIAPPLLPPLLAIALAFITKQVLVALFAGVWIGALMTMQWNVLGGTTKTLEWIIGNVTDSWNATILVFDFIIGALIGVLYISGSMFSLASELSKKVKSARGVSLLGWFLGVAVFFDDYANTVIVGNASRPLTDKLRVSRELLSYIVDSTAAPVAGLAIVSTWIGYEVSLIKDSFGHLQSLFSEGKIAMAPDVGAMYAWLMSVPFRYYSILAIILVLLVVLTRRHYGPMLKAEYRAVSEGKPIRDGAQPLMPTETVLGEAKSSAPWWIFASSVIVLVIITVFGMWVTGGGDEWWTVPFTDALMNADAATALLWGSFGAYIFAAATVLVTRSMEFSEIMDSTIRGMYLMVYANAILVLAWSIKSAAEAVGTAEYVVGLATAAGVPAMIVPAIVFLAACFISFTTGTSWGTFGVMMPIAIPMAWQVALLQGADPYIVTYASIASVFAGGIFGDHCSPISDTTIMSSMFSGSDHIDHVNTQLPYALTAAGISAVLFALFASGITLPLILLPVGVALLIVFHRMLNTWYARRLKLPEVIPNYTS